ncbi:sigma-70 family RNA polymerase sigma factor [Domibacillus robiginosus]|uniref:sigma-70 family RNA polymerase sigma factor n=1 Tax=Domibacillus robiginosus TaxID=1071054 RepID=UPI00067DB5C1|nr:sigma-70 family RNA polymerase sigma factor [Domibacillus robiginosus]
MQFEQLAKQYTPMIHRILQKLHIYKNKDEFVQVGMIALWEACERFDEAKGAFPPFAYSYIQGRIKSTLTKDAKTSDKMVLTGEPVLYEGIDPAPTPDTVAAVHLCGDLLTGRAKDWYNLSVIEGLTNPDIARKLGVTPAAVRKWQLSAQAVLKARFAEEQ